MILTQKTSRKTHTESWHKLSHFTTNTLWCLSSFITTIWKWNLFMKHDISNTFTIIFYLKLLLMNGLVYFSNHHMLLQKNFNLPRGTLWGENVNDSRSIMFCVVHVPVKTNIYHQTLMFLFQACVALYKRKQYGFTISATRCFRRSK